MKLISSTVTHSGEICFIYRWLEVILSKAIKTNCSQRASECLHLSRCRPKDALCPPWIWIPLQHRCHPGLVETNDSPVCEIQSTGNCVGQGPMAHVKEDETLRPAMESLCETNRSSPNFTPLFSDSSSLAESVRSGHWNDSPLWAY